MHRWPMCKKRPWQGASVNRHYGICLMAPGYGRDVLPPLLSREESPLHTLTPKLTAAVSRIWATLDDGVLSVCSSLFSFPRQCSFFISETNVIQRVPFSHWRHIFSSGRREPVKSCHIGIRLRNIRCNAADSFLQDFVGVGKYQAQIALAHLTKGRAGYGDNARIFHQFLCKFLG